MTSTLLRNVRPWGGAAADVELRDGVIAAITPATGIRGTGGPADDPADDPAAEPTAAATTVVDGAGRILVPSFSDVHVHLDSTRLGLPFRPHTAQPGLWNMVMNDRTNWRDGEVSTAERSSTALRMGIERGATRIRSYAQVDADAGLERFEGVLAARAEHADRADVAIIVFPQAGLLREPGVPELMEEALKQGADVMGGIDPCAMDGDPVRHLDIVFGLAEKYGVPIDIHLHEAGELGMWSFGKIIERTRALGMHGLVTVSHALALGSGGVGGSVSDAAVDAVLDQMAELDMALATIAPASRGALPLARIAERGIRIGLGQDGQRDYWSPYGNADMLDRTWQLAFTQGYRADDLIEHALAVATVGGASVIDPTVTRLSGVADRPGVAVGEPAELVLLEGETVTAAVMDRLPGRTVIHRGRVVADGLELTAGSGGAAAASAATTGATGA